MHLNLSSLKILIVEDIMPMRDLIVELLTAMGVGQVFSAPNGDAGYRLYCSKKPDIILTDWHMPVLDGIGMIQKIRKDPQSHNRTIPIIMVTGFSSLEKIKYARDRGVTEFLIKPFSASQLSARIEHVIKSPRDVIITPQFIGPDRRRKPDDNSKDSGRTGNPPPKSIPADTSLQLKTGYGKIEERRIAMSQNVLNNADVNFMPIAMGFLKDLQDIVETSQANNTLGRQAIEEMIYPIMQIKSSALVFKYTLVGNLAGIMLSFLESLNDFDNDVLKIITAHHHTISHLLNSNIKEQSEIEGKDFEDELQKACKRYTASRAKRAQGIFIDNQTANQT